MISHVGAWYNGSIGVSKTFDGSSILSAPAIWKNRQIFWRKNIEKGIVIKGIAVSFNFVKN